MKGKALSADISRNTLISGTVLLLIIVRILFWMLQNPFPGHDQCLLLFDARQMLAGAQLYGQTIVEPDPPLIIWFSAIPVFLSRLFGSEPPHVRETAMLYIVLSALVCLSVLWCTRLAARRGWGRPGLFLLAAVLLLIECPQAVLLIAQREDLLLICALPYIIGVALDAMPELTIYERCALGALAGLAVCFKPQQTVILVSIEIAIAFITRSLRHLRSAEFLSSVFVCCLFVGSVLVFAPLYFKQNVPLLVDVYWAFGSFSAGALMLHQLPELLVLCIVVGLSLILLKDGRDRRAVLVLAACALSAAVAFAVQRTGWGYQQYPAVAFAIVAAALLLMLVLAPVIGDSHAASTPLMKWVAISLVLLLCTVEWKQWRPAQLPNDAGVFAGLHPGDNVFFISTDVSFFAVAYARDLNWGSRFPHLWLLPAILENEQRDRPAGAPFKKLSPATMAKLSDLQRTDLAADLDHWQPKVVLVESCPCPFVKHKVDLLAWFSADPSFRFAWSHYVKARDISGFRVFERAN